MNQEMSQRLAGKTAFLTAAGQGIGRATAIAFAREGARVIATDINAGLLDSLAAEIGSGCTVQRLDVTDAAAITAAAAQHGPVDVLLNGAGFVHAGTVLDCTEEEWDFAFLLNVRSQFRIIKAFLPGMLERGGGSIVNVASVAGSIKGAPNRFVYGATKAAVIGLTKSIALDYIKQGIRCNAIAPGTVQSPSLEERMKAQGNYEEARAAFIARQPMGRIGQPEEIAALAVYLGSDVSNYTTGQVHVIDGGMSL